MRFSLRHASLGLLLILLAACGGRSAARTRVVHAHRTPAASTLALQAARRFLREWERREYAAQWAELSPAARAEWPGPRARARMLRAKFSGDVVRQIHLGVPVRNSAWQSLEDTRRHVTETWRVPVSITFAGRRQPGAVAGDYRRLSLSLTVHGKKTLVVGEGPASLDAPLVFPAHPAHARLHVPILMYHRISALPLPSQWTDSYGYSIEYGLTVPPAQFAAEMRYLAGHHVTAISLTRLADALLYGLPLPQRSVVITFDDGRASPWQYAVPLLRRYGFTAVFFPCAGLVGQTVEAASHLNVQRYLSWDQIHRLAQMGFWIEDHGQKDRQVLWTATPAQLQTEAGASAQQLAAHSGEPAQFIAYTGALWPYPSAAEVGPQQQAMFPRLAGLGYVGGVTDTRISSGHESTADLWHLPRIRVQPGESLPDFTASLAG